MSFDYQLPQGWSWETIDSIKAEGRSIVSGPFGSAIGSRFFVESGVPVIRGNNLKLGMERFCDNGFVFLSDEKALEFKNCEALHDDIVLTAAGTIGQVGIIPSNAIYPKYIISNKQIRVRTDKLKVLPLFVYYWLSSPEMTSTIQSRNTGSTIPLINLSVVKSLPIPVPPLNIQKRILDVLGCLDDRIILLRETNATLEAIAQALFKSWFVDFDPVHANAGTQTPSLPPEIQALFPATFTDSPQGPIPEGWEVKQLGEVTAYLNRGISPKYVETGGVVVINQKCIRDFAVDLSKARRHDPIQRKIDGRILEMGDILVNSTGVGTLGRVAQLLEVNETMIIDSHVTAVRANSELSWPYLGLALMRKQPEIEAMGEGTTGQTELARAKLAMLPIVCPPEEVLKVFDDIVTPLKKTLAANSTKAENLSTLRDTLLPRLISGQLRLTEAEQAIAAITD